MEARLRASADLMIFALPSCLNLISSLVLRDEEVLAIEILLKAGERLLRYWNGRSILPANSERIMRC